MSHFLNNTAVATNYLRLPQLKRNNCHNTLQTFNQTVYEGFINGLSHTLTKLPNVSGTKT